MVQRARRYFRMGDQYFVTAQLLLDTLANNGNSNAGFGCSAQEAEEEKERNTNKSDSDLFVPAMFNCLQCTELFAKGLLLLNRIESKNTHDIQKLLELMKGIYNPGSKIYEIFGKIYFSQKEILKEYRKQNEIFDAETLYVSLRYPEDIKGKQFDYCELIYNGDKGIKLFKTIGETMVEMRGLVVTEYNRLGREEA